MRNMITLAMTFLFTINFWGCSKREKEIDVQKINLVYTGLIGSVGMAMEGDTTILWNNNTITKYDAGSRPTGLFSHKSRIYVSGIINGSSPDRVGDLRY